MGERGGGGGGGQKDAVLPEAPGLETGCHPGGLSKRASVGRLGLKLDLAAPPADRAAPSLMLDSVGSMRRLKPDGRAEGRTEGRADAKAEDKATQN
jgi:hypothetical protein